MIFNKLPDCTFRFVMLWCWYGAGTVLVQSGYEVGTEQEWCWYGAGMKWVWCWYGMGPEWVQSRYEVGMVSVLIS